MRTETRFPATGGFYTVAVGCDVEADPANIDRAIERLEAAMTPADRDQCEDWITALQAACARRNDGENIAEVAYDLYTDALRQYPADVAKAACVGIATKPGLNWFPVLGELTEKCDALASPRKHMLAGLKRSLAKPLPALEKDTAPEPEDRKAYVASLLRGFTRPLNPND